MKSNEKDRPRNRSELEHFLVPTTVLQTAGRPSLGHRRAKLSVPHTFVYTDIEQLIHNSDMTLWRLWMRLSRQAHASG